MAQDIQKIRRLLDAGAQITGAAIGGALGFLASGPVTAAGAAVLGTVAAHTLQEFCTRQLSHRETVRISMVSTQENLIS